MIGNFSFLKENINFDDKSGEKKIDFGTFRIFSVGSQIRIKLKTVLKKINDFMAKNAFFRFSRFLFFSEFFFYWLVHKLS